MTNSREFYGILNEKKTQNIVFCSCEPWIDAFDLMVRTMVRTTFKFKNQYIINTILWSENHRVHFRINISKFSISWIKRILVTFIVTLVVLCDNKESALIRIWSPDIINFHIRHSNYSVINIAECRNRKRSINRNNWKTICKFHEQIYIVYLKHYINIVNYQRMDSINGNNIRIIRIV